MGDNIAPITLNVSTSSGAGSAPTFTDQLTTFASLAPAAVSISDFKDTSAPDSGSASARGQVVSSAQACTSIGLSDQGPRANANASGFTWYVHQNTLVPLVNSQGWGLIGLYQPVTVQITARATGVNSPFQACNAATSFDVAATVSQPFGFLVPNGFTQISGGFNATADRGNNTTASTSGVLSSAVPEISGNTVTLTGEAYLPINLGYSPEYTIDGQPSFVTYGLTDTSAGWTNVADESSGIVVTLDGHPVFLYQPGIVSAIATSSTELADLAPQDTDYISMDQLGFDVHDANAVPEPSSLGLLFFGGIALLHRRRSRGNPAIV